MSESAAQETQPRARSVTLGDGRALAYAEWGDPSGTPVLFFHGSQSSRLERHPDDSIARARNVRLITIDRPGHGLSDFQPDRTLLDWPGDAAALADALGLDRFAVMGMSAGGPYALACALKMPERLTSATIIASAAPLDVPEVRAHLPRQLKTMFGVAHIAPWLVSAMLSRARKKALADPVKAVEPALKQFSAPDQAVLARPEIRAVLPSMYAEAYRLDQRGPAWEVTHTMSRPWGFRVEDVRMHVNLWQGEADNNVPVEWGRWFAATLPDCTAHFLPGEGHLLIFDHWGEILDEALS